MSKIATITAQAGAQSLRVEYAVRSLEISLVGVSTGTLSWASFYALFIAMELEVNKQTKNGTVPVLQRMSVMSLFVLAQTNGGIIQASHVETVSQTNSIAHSIELSDFGAIPLLDGEFFEINFFNFPVSASTVFTLDVHALDDKDLSSVHNVYEKAYFNANSPREIDVRDVKTISIPVAYFDSMELSFKTGRRVRYTKTEILSMMRDGLGVRSLLVSSVGGASDTLVNTVGDDLIYNISSATTAKLTTTVSTNVILLKHSLLS